jgi:hypothetical protein
MHTATGSLRTEASDFAGCRAPAQSLPRRHQDSGEPDLLRERVELSND